MNEAPHDAAAGVTAGAAGMSIAERSAAPRPLTVSVVIPLFNGAPYIAAALRSVFAQTLRPHEIIVVDDGSTDDGPERVRALAGEGPVILLRKTNGGQSSARNMGIRWASGTLIALLDQDDLWYPDHLERLVAPFRDDPQGRLGWVYSNLDEINQDGRIVVRAALDACTTPHPKDSLVTCLREDMFILPSATVVSRAALLAVGAFDESLSGYEDDDLFVRLFHAGYAHAYVRTPLGQWRIHAASSSYSARMARSRMGFARKLIDAFPDDEHTGRHYVRDVTAPRFLAQVSAEARAALRRGDLPAAERHFADMAWLRARIPPNHALHPARREHLITVVIPLYNGAAFIRETLDSVFAQTLPPDEIIVVDDGSADDGPAIVAEMARSRPIRLLRKANGGQSAARNFGVAHAHGDLIAFLDHDDVWYPDHLKTLVGPFRDAPPGAIAWTYGDLDEIDRAGNLVQRRVLRTGPSPHPKVTLFACLSADMFILPSAALVSRAALIEVGGFNEQLSGYEDDDLFLRLFRTGRDHVYLDQPVTRWRIFPDSASHSRRMAQSRMIYMRHLLELFPDDRPTGRHYATGMIAPRFLRLAFGDYRRALLTEDAARARAAVRDMREIAGHLHPLARVVTRPLLMPLLLPSLGRAGLSVLFGLRGVLRRLRRAVVG